MSSQNFESLEEDFLALKDGIVAKLYEMHKLSGQKRKNLVRDVQRELDDAQRLLEDLEVEVKNAPYPYRLQMNNRVKQFRQELSNLNKKVLQSESSITSSNSRSQLFAPSDPSSSSNITPSSMIANNRGRLLQMNETVDQTTKTVYRTQQIAAETDQVGIAVVDELGTQREALIRTKERLVDTDVNLTRSRKILRSMYRKVMTNKLILVVIILLELGILGGVIWYKFFRK